MELLNHRKLNTMSPCFTSKRHGTINKKLKSMVTNLDVMKKYYKITKFWTDIKSFNLWQIYMFNKHHN